MKLAILSIMLSLFNPLFPTTVSALALVARQEETICPSFNGGQVPGPVNVPTASALNYIFELGYGNARITGDTTLTIDARPLKTQGHVVVHIGVQYPALIENAAIFSYFDGGRLPTGRALPKKQWRVATPSSGTTVDTIDCLQVSDVGNGYWYVNLER